MIPVVTTDKEGNLSNQIFNDDLTLVEQINRIVLKTIAYAQTELTNGKNAFDQNVDHVGYTDKQLTKIKEVSLELQRTVVNSIKKFNIYVADPDYK